VSGAWAGSNLTDAGGWKRVNVSGLGGGRVGDGAARGAGGAPRMAARRGVASGGERQIGFKSSDRGI
jgi:hypothetical protein